MSTLSLSAAQHLVLSRIASGETIQAAADAAGVHRNSVLHWRRAIPSFRASWDSVQYDLAMQWREQALPLAPLALDAIRGILSDPQTPASVRLRAALAIHKMASTPPPAERHASPHGNRSFATGTNNGDPQSDSWEGNAAAQTLITLLERLGAVAASADSASAHSTAQPPADPAANQANTPVVQPETLHNPAQSPVADAAPTQSPAANNPVVQPETMHNPAQRRYTAQELAKAFPERPAITMDPQFANTFSGRLFEQIIQRKQSEILAREERLGKKAA